MFSPKQYPSDIGLYHYYRRTQYLIRYRTQVTRVVSSTGLQAMHAPDGVQSGAAASDAAATGAATGANGTAATFARPTAAPAVAVAED